jgi:enoyl-CoA hydratase/carnithine racemase
LLVEALKRLLDDARSDDSVRAVVLTGEGGTFCAGADLTDPPVPSGSGSFADLLRLLWEYPKPIIIAINGHVRAGGLGLVACGDIVVCASAATFAFSEVRIGVSPAMISVLCLRRMTPLASARYMLSGEVFSPDDARSAGLVTSVVSGDDLPGAVDYHLANLAHCEPAALAVTRSLLREVPERGVLEGLSWTQDVSATLFASPAAAEGIAAFKEKRKPSWAVQAGT